MKHLTDAALDELAASIETEMPEAAEMIRNRNPEAIRSWEADIAFGMDDEGLSTIEVSPNVTRSGRPMLLDFVPRDFVPVTR